ncbi:MAG: TIR domain-containing protein [Gammaproteobacteria bacterium]
MTEPSRAVFLSYASQDAEAARRICEALRSGGIEVWLDQSELRGGDAWDRQIRKQIHECALFVPIISANSQARLEGYFRLEWKLAVERTHLMSERAAFLVPVIIDDTRDAHADVPEAFRAMQWTRLPAGETSAAFVARVSQLLSPSQPQTPAQARLATAPAPSFRPSTANVAASRRSKLLPLLISAVVLLGIGLFALDKFVLSKRVATPATQVDLAATVASPEKSVAVLPFVNESSDREQEYFADGLSETMIDLLSKVPDLHVAARTSSFYFKGKSEKLTTIAKELNVANVLEGSVRKAGNRLRITAQLVRTDNGYHLWSETYDRDTKDIFKVQDEISAAVVAALKLKLAAHASVAGSRGTTNSEAYNQFLIGQHFNRTNTLDGYRRALVAYDNALALDPHYEMARTSLALTSANIADQIGDGPGLERALADMEQSVARAPDQAWSYRHRGLARSTWLWDYAGATSDFEKAIALDPTEPFGLMDYGAVLAFLGQFKAAIEMTQKALALDPLATDAIGNLAQAQLALRDWAAAEATLVRLQQISPGNEISLGTSTNPGMAALRLLQGRPTEALTFCQQVTELRIKMPCVAQAEYSSNHKPEAEAALAELLKTGATNNTYAIAQTYAWRGETAKAFEWFDKAAAVRDAGLPQILMDRQLDSLHKDPRWKALLKKVNLPE